MNCPEDVWPGPVYYTDNLQYIKLPENATNDDAMFEYVREHKDDILFKKHTSWEKENEYRFISRSQEKLDISNAITAIYVQNGQSVDSFILDDIVGDQVPISVMKYEEIAGVLSPKVYPLKKYHHMLENTIKSQDETERLVKLFGLGDRQ